MLSQFGGEGVELREGGPGVEAILVREGIPDDHAVLWTGSILLESQSEICDFS